MFLFLFRQAGPTVKLDQENCTNEFLCGQYRYTRLTQSKKTKSHGHILFISCFDKKNTGPTNQQNPFGRMLLYSFQPLAQITQSCYQSLLKQDQILFLNWKIMYLLTFGPTKGRCFLVSHIEGSARIVYMRQHQRIFAHERGRGMGAVQWCLAPRYPSANPRLSIYGNSDIILYL